MYFLSAHSDTSRYTSSCVKAPALLLLSPAAVDTGLQQATTVSPRDLDVVAAEVSPGGVGMEKGIDPKHYSIRIPIAENRFRFQLLKTLTGPNLDSKRLMTNFVSETTGRDRQVGKIPKSS